MKEWHNQPVTRSSDQVGGAGKVQFEVQFLMSGGVLVLWEWSKTAH